MSTSCLALLIHARKDIRLLWQRRIEEGKYYDNNNNNNNNSLLSRIADIFDPILTIMLTGMSAVRLCCVAVLILIM